MTIRRQGTFATGTGILKAEDTRWREARRLKKQFYVPEEWPEAKKS